MMSMKCKHTYIHAYIHTHTYSHMVHARNNTCNRSDVCFSDLCLSCRCQDKKIKRSRISEDIRLAVEATILVSYSKKCVCMYVQLYIYV